MSQNLANTADTDKNHPKCVFHGGVLDGKKQKRMMFGYVPHTIMEPVYLRDKKGDANRKDITERHTYVRDPRSDKDGALGYVLYSLEVVA